MGSKNYGEAVGPGTSDGWTEPSSKGKSKINDDINDLYDVFISETGERSIDGPMEPLSPYILGFIKRNPPLITLIRLKTAKEGQVSYNRPQSTELYSLLESLNPLFSEISEEWTALTTADECFTYRPLGTRCDSNEYGATVYSLRVPALTFEGSDIFLILLLCNRDAADGGPTKSHEKRSVFGLTYGLSPEVFTKMLEDSLNPSSKETKDFRLQHIHPKTLMTSLLQSLEEESIKLIMKTRRTLGDINLSLISHESDPRGRSRLPDPNKQRSQLGKLREELEALQFSTAHFGGTVEKLQKCVNDLSLHRDPPEEAAIEDVRNVQNTLLSHFAGHSISITNIIRDIDRAYQKVLEILRGIYEDEKDVHFAVQRDLLEKLTELLDTLNKSATNRTDLMKTLSECAEKQTELTGILNGNTEEMKKLLNTLNKSAEEQINLINTLNRNAETQTYLINMLRDNSSEQNKVAMLMADDSRNMKFIAILTVLFLPGTFMAIFLTTPMFKWPDPPDGQTIVPRPFTIYWAVSASVTLILLAWSLRNEDWVTKRFRPKKAGSVEDEDEYEEVLSIYRLNYHRAKSFIRHIFRCCVPTPSDTASPSSSSLSSADESRGRGNRNGRRTYSPAEEEIITIGGQNDDRRIVDIPDDSSGYRTVSKR